MQPNPPYAAPPGILVVSTPFVPGHRIVNVVGFTWGLTVRSRGLGGNIMAGLRTLGGGEIREYTQMLDHARWEALQRLMDHARSLGANAVVGVDFDSSEIGDIMSEVLAYGTAVVVQKDDTTPQPVTLR